MSNVVFGSGPLGRAVVDALVERGEPVRVVNRSGRLPDAPRGVEVVAADAFDLEASVQAARGSAVVYNCAATAYSAQSWRTELPRLWGNIAQAAERSGARLVVGDNLYMYDQAPGAILESRAMHSTTAKGQARIALAQQLLELHRAGRVPVAFVRGSNFFGRYAAEQSHFGTRVIPPLLHGKAAMLVGNLDVPHSLTYLEDFGRAMVLVGAAGEDAYGRPWHVPNAPVQTRRATLEVLGQIMGVKPRAQTVRGIGLDLLALAVPALREVREMRYQFEQPYTVGHADFNATFGDIHTPLETALERTVAWFKTLEGNATALHTA
jgi:nucleoside-diphosphate-sugar epimerase